MWCNYIRLTLNLNRSASRYVPANEFDLRDCLHSEYDRVKVDSNCALLSLKNDGTKD